MKQRGSLTEPRERAGKKRPAKWTPIFVVFCALSKKNIQIQTLKKKIHIHFFITTNPKFYRRLNFPTDLKLYILMMETKIVSCAKQNLYLKRPSIELMKIDIQPPVKEIECNQYYCHTIHRFGAIYKKKRVRSSYCRPLGLVIDMTDYNRLL